MESERVGAHGGAGGQLLQQLGGCLRLPRKHQLRVEVTERAQHKLALVGAGVGQGKAGCGSGFAAAADEVDIAGAGFAVFAAAGAAQLLLNAQA